METGFLWVTDSEGDSFAINPNCISLVNFQWSRPIDGAPEVREANIRIIGRDHCIKVTGTEAQEVHAFLDALDQQEDE